jgi:exonuclease I
MITFIEGSLITLAVMCVAFFYFRYRLRVARSIFMVSVNDAEYRHWQEWREKRMEQPLEERLKDGEP